MRPFTPEQVASFTNLVIDTVAQHARAGELLPRIRAKQITDVERAVIESAAKHAWSEFHEVPYDEDADKLPDYEGWWTSAMLLAVATGWPTPYEYSITDLDGKVRAGGARTLGFFTEDTLFTHDDMVAINALEVGHVYVSPGTEAVLKVERMA